MHHIVGEVRYEGKDDDAFQKRVSDAWIQVMSTKIALLGLTTLFASMRVHDD
jgi:hypothetical protein